MKPRVAENLRAGATLMETVIAVALLAAVMTLTLQTLTAMKAARRDHQRRQVALQEAANCLERLRAHEPGELEKAASQARLSEAARQTLPDGKLQAEVSADEATGGTRVEVQVHWQSRGGLIEAPIKLSAWRWENR